MNLNKLIADALLRTLPKILEHFSEFSGLYFEFTPTPELRDALRKSLRLQHVSHRRRLRLKKYAAKNTLKPFSHPQGV